MKTLIFATLIVLGASANAVDCGQVVVDCNAGRISIPGLQKFSEFCGEADRIDCGRPTHNSSPGKPGKVGGIHAGRRVRNGQEILNIPGMGNSGGGKVFHTSNPDNPRSCPKHQTWGLGCISVSKEVLARLRQCQGSDLVIVGAIGGEGTTQYASASRHSRTRVARHEPVRRYTSMAHSWSGASR